VNVAQIIGGDHLPMIDHPAEYPTVGRDPDAAAARPAFDKLTSCLIQQEEARVRGVEQFPCSVGHEAGDCVDFEIAA
jgi:hypothetical protein